MILPTRLHQDRFQSTHPLRGATAPQEIMPHVEAISIHAPLAGCDQAVVDKKQDRRHISIHAPLAGCDLINSVNKEKVKSFQSTHPLRGATAPAAGKLLGQSFQSTHPLRGATCLLRILKSSEKFQSTHPLRGATSGAGIDVRLGEISIHAPLAGCDDICMTVSIRACPFQSTHPLRGATSTKSKEGRHAKFQSTHPLRGATGAAG